MKARIEFEITPIRHIAVQCPNCEKWFDGRDITHESLHDIVDVKFAEYQCPICNKIFDGKDLDCIECGDADEVYKDCLTKKVSWE